MRKNRGIIRGEIISIHSDHFSRCSKRIEAIESSAETSSTSETTSGSNEATSESKDNEVTSGASQSKQGNG